MSDEDLPEPSDKLTRPERFVAERLTPYRVYWIKMSFNILIIACFIWAGFLMMDYRAEAQEVHDLVKEKGCGGLPAEWEPEVTGPGADQYNSSSSLDRFQLNSSQQVDPPG